MSRSLIDCRVIGVQINVVAILADAELVVFVLLAALLSCQELINLRVVARPLGNALENVSGLIVPPVNVAVKISISVGQPILEHVCFDD